MAITKENKKEIIDKFKTSEKDTGSSQVQIAILTVDIQNLTLHLKKHRKDVSTERSLVKKVARRNSLLNYLKNKDINVYRKLIEALNLRK